MHDQDKAIVRSLISVAWADGKVTQEEIEVIEALLQAFSASPEELEELRKYAETPRTLEDIPVSDLSRDDRRTLLQHAVLLTYIDGEQDDKERALLKQLCEKIRSRPTKPPLFWRLPT